ncbi:hypothetical protein [Paenibacillus naphthalenovorans]|uniref:Uncharacterized protein n=1 Tax=Paenibacillus naphthalenovorans TaxID=162209 RepID=A0A0U2UJN4_9BACL|nr:hypothetical protein [Paenibacillus naphthalenovorans]ALS22129.1 hypothetical protein IJ22_17550 [Paenibacillus naphthalenovorans]
MNKPILKHGNSYSQNEQLSKEGKYISIPFKFLDVVETERQREIREIINKYNYMRSDDEVELTMDAINEMCNDREVKISEPFNGVPRAYNIDFGDIEAYITITDEYWGQGNYDYSISLDGIIVKDNVSNERVVEVATWLDEAFNG